MRHHTRLKTSKPLQRLLAFLKKVGDKGATTWQIMMAVKTCSVAEYISDLRAEGFVVKSVFEGINENNSKIWRYTLK